MTNRCETLSRRQFFEHAATSTVALLLAPACTGQSYESPSLTTSTAAACPGVAAASSVVLQHSHSLCVPDVDLSSPPPTATYETTESEGHTHLVSLSGLQLNAINGQQAVPASTSITENHLHQFTIVKANVNRGGGAGGPANGGGNGSGAGTGETY
jgi:hypothetical protein